MKFTKMQGCGNDYIYIDGSRERVADKPELARRLSDRHFGIGGDGVIFINPSQIADFEMEMYNADGSRGKMCGNGIRCVAKYVYDHGMTEKNPLTIESCGSVKTLFLTIKDGKVDTVRVDMGEPILEASVIPADPTKLGRPAELLQSTSSPQRVPPEAMPNPMRSQQWEGYAAETLGKSVRMTEDNHPGPEKTTNGFGEGNRLIHVPYIVDGAKEYMTAVSMGNPHAVLFLDELPGQAVSAQTVSAQTDPVYCQISSTDELDLLRIGPAHEHHPAFPQGVNTEFVQVLDRTHMKMRVWERGSGETLACGTGACASVVAAVLNGRTERCVTVHLIGGDLQIEWNEADNHVYMTGPARTVFSGEVEADLF